jgi:hypothetical protein
MSLNIDWLRVIRSSLVADSSSWKEEQSSNTPATDLEYELVRQGITCVS